MNRTNNVVNRRTVPVVALALSWAVIGLNGCGGIESSKDAPASSNGGAVAGAPATQAEAARADKAPGAPASGMAQLVNDASAVPRKIIYNATVDLVSDNFSEAQRNLLRLVKSHRGYVAETNVGGTAGTPRQGSWKVRIPTDQFDDFMAVVAKLGELQTTHTDSQDVTAEFYDLQARISNKQVEEKRLIEHLQRSTAKLTDILTVERELSRVRGEIEQMQGRVRVLANQTALTTVAVSIHEVKGYVPPRPASFGAQMARTFNSSLTSMRDVGMVLALMIVGLAPWLLVFALIGLPLWLAIRRLSARYPPVTRPLDE